MDTWYDLEKGYANLHPNVEKMREFFITKHAHERIEKRVSQHHRHRLYSHAVKSWTDGKKAPKGFYRDKAKKPRGFDIFKYKYYLGYVWIWALRRVDGVNQKHLITIYHWDNIDLSKNRLGYSNRKKASRIWGNERKPGDKIYKKNCKIYKKNGIL